MFRRIRGFIFAIAFAVLGAVLGRVVARLRRQAQAGEAMRLDMDAITIRPKDVIPGIIAAMRVRERPWSFLHLPSWLAAFSVNFAFAALAREFGPLMDALRGGGDEDEWPREADRPSGASTVWTAEGAGGGQQSAPGPSGPPSGFRAFSE